MHSEVSQLGNGSKWQMRWGRLASASGLGVLLCLLPLSAQEKPKTDATTSGRAGGVGFSANAEATSADVGLPIYPGAKPHKDKGEDSSAMQLEMWGKLAGFKMVVLKLESNDAPGKIVPFYENALGKYGKVVNCSGAQAETQVKKDQNGDDLECYDATERKNGTVELKAGTKEEQHLVGVEPNGTGSLVHLVYVDSRGIKSDK